MIPVLRRSLTARLTAAFLGLSIGTVALATFVSYRVAEGTLRERLLDHLATLADEDAAGLTTWYHRQRAAIELMARWESTRAAVQSPGGNILGRRGIVLVDPSIIAATEVVLLTVPGGRVIRSSHPERLDTYAVDQLYYQQGRDSTFTQTVYPSGTDGRPMMSVATPVRAPDGTTIAVLAAHLDLTQMERVLRRREGEVPIDAFLVNRFAEFVSSARFGRAQDRRGVHSHAIDAARGGDNDAGLYRDHEGRPVAGAWRWLPELELALVLEAPQQAAFAPARKLLVDALFIGVLAAGLLTFGVVAISHRFTRPVLAVANAAERVAAGDFSSTAPVAGPDEVGQLARAFNTMTGRLRAVYGELEEQVSATTGALVEAQASRSLLQDVVNNATTIILVVGLDGRVQLANTRFTSVAGIPPGNAVGLPVSAILPATLMPLLERARNEHTVVEHEVEIGPQDEAHTWQAVAFPLRLADGTPYATGLIAADLTERARAEEERRARDATVQQTQRLESLGVMAGGIAHDFNNLLGAIRGNVELAQGAVHDPAEVRDALDQIAAASRRASELTRQMLAYSGRASLKREVLDARTVFDDIVPLVRAAQPKKVDIVVTPMPAPLVMEIDPAQLSQVVLNLLTNAAEAIGDAAGTVTLSASREASAPDPGEDGDVPVPDAWIRIRVEDTGVGIPEQVQERIFDPFFSTKSSGRGLGLSAVRGIIRTAGGILHVRSVPDVGTRFDAWLPASTTEAPAEIAVMATDAVLRTGTVLVVDDEPALRSVARRTLEKDGLCVLEAADGAEGLERFRSHESHVSLVMLDLTMPGMGGGEVLTEIRRTHPRLPVIIASGYDRADEMGSMAQDGSTRFLQKPFGINALRAVVGEMLG